ncbi:hypothetical protein HER32_09915 [Hymenobacter sp. BT18]|uniref:hypothetical protein n=1 Tax=Hymenobacter sp. BT18 TaxID=2835648 RepID=UPI00143EB3EC|nr:hypothetical protein [Hymenobacter sp. BT18]QIX61475.1 hypothetical protein HER32_09915 [Hymenobacter sp. BT18]
MPLLRSRNIARWFIGPFSGQERSYWRAITACFLAASTFWLLNALNKVYTTRITYPLEWRYDARRYVPVQPLPREVAVNVTGRGWKLLRRSLMLDVRPAEIQLERLPSTRFVAAQQMRPSLLAAMEGLQLNYVLTDTIFVEFDRLVTRRLPLMLSPTADGAALPFVARFEPDSISFRGPSQVIARLSSPYLVHLPQAPAGSSSGSIRVPIGGPRLVTTNVQDVRVRLQPRPLVSQVISVMPALHNFPVGQPYTIRPVMLRVEVQSFAEDTPRLDMKQVRALLDFGQLRPADSTLQPLLMPTQPPVRGARLLTPLVRVSLSTHRARH